MSRKQRTPKLRVEVPAVTYYLMAGEWAPCRIHGWVVAVQEWEAESQLQRMWDAHGEAWTAEASRFGFVPAWVSGQCPEGEGFTRWQREFLEQHRY